MMKEKILLIDDDRLMRKSVEETLRRAGYEVTACENGEAGLDALKRDRFNLILSDMKMPGMDGITVLEKAREINNRIPFIIMTAYGSVDTAVEATKKGAFDFIEKPFKSIEELEMRVSKGLEFTSLKEENKNLRQQLKQKYEYIGKSKAMREVDELVKSVAESKTTILITGESGTGKELVARALHVNSPRQNGPFIKVNCAALVETLIESELFGHKKGAFTGALKDTRGKFELASGGTLLLDEIGEMPMNIQSKLLRVLQEREIDKVGGDHPVPVDVRIVATTNRDLKKEVAAGNFREDLYYRLAVVPVSLQPLRERKDDIPALVDHFIDLINKENGFSVERCSPEALNKLSTYHWPGNIRELENMVERAVVLQKRGVLKPAHFTLSRDAAVTAPDGNELAAGKTISEMEKMLIFKTLEATGNNKTKAADMLGISIRTLRNKLQEYEKTGNAGE